jgi:hypothetical protein
MRTSEGESWMFVNKCSFSYKIKSKNKNENENRKQTLTRCHHRRRHIRADTDQCAREMLSRTKRKLKQKRKKNREKKRHAPAATIAGDTYAPTLINADVVAPGAPDVVNAGPSLPALATKRRPCSLTACFATPTKIINQEREENSKM